MQVKFRSLFREKSASYGPGNTVLGWNVQRWVDKNSYVIFVWRTSWWETTSETLRALNRASWYTYVRETNKMDIFLNSLLYLIYPPHVSNKYMVIIRRSFVQAAYNISPCTLSCLYRTPPDDKQLLVRNMSRITYLLTPWSRVLLEKLTGFAACQEIPRIYGTQTFITVLTSPRHLSLSWARSIESPPPPPTSWRSILIFSHLRLVLPNGLFPSSFPTKTCRG
jgi:hypothetical protein